MLVSDCVHLINAEVLCGQESLAATVVADVVVSDLMSDVLLVEREDFLLVTSLTSDQMVRTADIVGARAIVVVNNKQLQEGTVRLACEHGIPLVRTAMRTFDVCRALVRALDGETRGTGTPSHTS